MMIEKPTDILEKEHRVIERAVAAMMRAADDLEAGHEVDVKLLSSIVVFMRGYADRIHQGKEEADLFPLLVAKGIPSEGWPIAALMAEHRRGRALVGEFVHALAAYARDSSSGRADLVQKLRELTDLYPDHIWKEDYLLFPMTNSVLSLGDQETLRKDFEAAEGALDAEIHRQFEQWTPDLWAKV